MSFTLEELRVAIEETENEDYDGAAFYHEVGYARNGMVVPGIGTAFCVEQFGGMDQGSDLWVVFRIEADERLWRKSGYYASHDGAYYDGSLEQVESFEKTVAYYRSV